MLVLMVLMLVSLIVVLTHGQEPHGGSPLL
jgi:hypothetical protein